MQGVLPSCCRHPPGVAEGGEKPRGGCTVGSRHWAQEDHLCFNVGWGGPNEWRHPHGRGRTVAGALCLLDVKSSPYCMISPETV